MSAVTLLAAALSLGLFLFALRLFKGSIRRRWLIGVLAVTVNPLLQFFGMFLQLCNGAGQMKDAFFKHLEVAAHSIGRLKPFGCGKWPFNFHSRVFSIVKNKNLAIFSIISITYEQTKYVVISMGYRASQLLA